MKCSRTWPIKWVYQNAIRSRVADPRSRILCFFDPWIRDGKDPDLEWSSKIIFPRA